MYHYIVIYKSGNLWSAINASSVLSKEEVESYYASGAIYDIVDITMPDKPTSMIVKYKLHLKNN